MRPKVSSDVDVFKSADGRTFIDVERLISAIYADIAINIDEGDPFNVIDGCRSVVTSLEGYIK